MSLLSHHAARCAILLAAVIGSVSATDAPVEKTPEQVLSELLTTHRSELTLAADGLGGAGAKALLDRARDAQFILIGEDHGFAEVPEFVLALRRSLGHDTPQNLVLEIGPYSAQRAAIAARDGSLSTLSRDYPAAMPFLNLQEDGAMASAWQHGDRRERLWGLDQEFLFSGRLILERLQVLSTTNAAKRAVADALSRNALADKQAMAEHDTAPTLLLQWQDADFAQLRAAVKPSRGSEAARLIDELDESAQIYRGQQTDGYASNNQRALLMKRHFMDYYRAAQKAGETLPRALFRFGANHMIRGISPTNLFDLGSFASEFAASNGRTSLHVLVLVGGGSANRWLPFVADAGLKTQPYDARAEMGDFGVMPFIEHANRSGWTVFDVDPLRRQREARQSAGAAFEKIVFGFDYVVVVAQGRAARDYAD